MRLVNAPPSPSQTLKGLVEKQPLLQQVVHLFQTMTEKTPNASLWLVGGAVRDALHTGKLGTDWDMVPCGITNINDFCEQLSRTLATRLQGTLVPLHEAFGMHRVVLKDGSERIIYVDVAACQGGTITDDLSRRDLSVNAMAMRLDGDTAEFVDPYQGANDLHIGLIRAISKQNLIDDPLRLLRVYRLAACLQASSIDEVTQGWIKQHAALLWNAAPERITTEWLRLLSAPPCWPWLVAMGQSGLLEVLLPELTPTHAIPPNSHHHLPLWDHTLELVNQAETTVFPSLSTALQNELQVPFHEGYTGNGITRQGLIHWACLLHDIGKPATHEILDDGRHAFHGHDRVGEDLTKAMAKRFKLGNDWTQTLTQLVRWHLYPCAFTPQSPRKSLLRFYRRLGHRTEDLLVLALADRLSTRGPALSDEQVTQDLSDLHGLLQDYREFRPALEQPPLIGGKDVMVLLGIPPGPALGNLLKIVRDKQLLGELSTQEEAEQWLLLQNGNWQERGADK
ncbi:MAG: HD domain-containing protein [Vampirovibrionales bacterium]|nr:HD domain-containing protein [Vampirovibrionales bacterium]